LNDFISLLLLILFALHIFLSGLFVVAIMEWKNGWILLLFYVFGAFAVDPPPKITLVGPNVCTSIEK
jgi:hypothetical protein